MGKRVAVVQSNYIPWKGYFDLIRRVDEFILFDDVQYTRRDWRNRNRIKTAQGLLWLTIPVEVKGRYRQTIRETRISDPGWNVRHWKTIAHHYARAPYFRAYCGALESLYLETQERYLSCVNHRFLMALCGLLGIGTRISRSEEYRLVEGKTERLIQLCRQAGAAEYWSGPSARPYLDEGAFGAAGVSVQYMDYSGYPEYRQLYPPFEHAVSVVDLILHLGPEAPRYMLSESRCSSPLSPGSTTPHAI